MNLHRLGWGAAMALSMACGGSEFTPDTTGGGGAGGTRNASVATTTGHVTTTGRVTTTGPADGTGGALDTTSGGPTTGSSATSASTATTVASTSGAGGAVTTSGSGGRSGTGGATGAGGSTAGTGGRTTTSTSSSTGTGGATGGTGGSRDAGTDASDPCPALRAEVVARLAEAQKCDPQITLACPDTVAGLCCPEPVVSKGSDATLAYLAAYDKYTSQHCFSVCTQIACRGGVASCQKDPSGTAVGYKCAFGSQPPP